MKIAADKIESIVHGWIVPPACRGQIVEVAYGDSRDGVLWRRVTDRSDRSVSYARADATDCGCAGECDCWDPANVEPSAYDWEVVS